MTAYFIRRLLLVPLTFVAITFLVYTIVRIVPGGPVEQAEMQQHLAAMAGEGGGGASTRNSNQQLDDDAIRELQRYYALDEPIPIGYLQWLGVWPKPVRTRVPESTLTREKAAFEPLQQLHAAQSKTKDQLDALLGDKYLAYQGQIYRPLTPDENTKLEAQDPKFFEDAHHLANEGFARRDELLAKLSARGLTYGGQATWFTRLEDTPSNHDLLQKAHDLLNALRVADLEFTRIAREDGYEVSEDGTIYKVEHRPYGVLQLQLGTSYMYNEPVLDLVKERLPISAQLGVTGYILTWLICVPLGIVKAIKHRTPIDTVTSFLVFLAYSIPGYVLCMILLTTIAARGWLPLGGWYPPESEHLTGLRAFGEHLKYMVIPMAGYMIGSFATMTILMKNSLIENLTADYVRTALAKGLTERRTIWVHALRNSLIPLTANIGSAVGVLLSGSFLIEKVTNVDGMGLLGYNAILQRDYPTVLGTLVLSVLIMLFGSILSDLIWAAIDPRIRFEVKS